MRMAPDARSRRCARRRHVEHERLAKSFLLALARIAERVGDHAATALDVILLAMQVAMQPELRLREQVVQRIAETRCRRRYAVAWVGAAQARSEVRDDHRGPGEGLRERSAQPRLAHERLF